jgi:hypothetical protein
MSANSKRKIVRTPPPAVRIVRDVQPKDDAKKGAFSYGTGNRKFSFGTGNRKFAFGTGNRQFEA